MYVNQVNGDNVYGEDNMDRYWYLRYGPIFYGSHIHWNILIHGDDYSNGSSKPNPSLISHYSSENRDTSVHNPSILGYLRVKLKPLLYYFNQTLDIVK